MELMERKISFNWLTTAYDMQRTAIIVGKASLLQAILVEIVFEIVGLSLV
jgi:hypothetical protein